VRCRHASTSQRRRVTLSSSLTVSLSAQVTAMCPSYSSSDRSSDLSTEAINSLVQAFISCHLQGTTATLFYGIAEGLMSRLQSVQNARHGVGRSTVRPYHSAATDFRFGVGWISRWPPWCTCHCPRSITIQVIRNRTR